MAGVRDVSGSAFMHDFVAMVNKTACFIKRQANFSELQICILVQPHTIMVEKNRTRGWTKNQLCTQCPHYHRTRFALSGLQ
jgi:hypothetical protein